MKPLCVLLYGLLVVLSWIHGGISVAEERVSVVAIQKGISQSASSGSTIRYDSENRRDPFTPIRKMSKPIPVKPMKPLNEPKILPEVEAPRWKLLGVIHAQLGRQAVLQNSSNERFLVGSGEEVAGSGWFVRAIEEDHVSFENPPRASSGEDSFKPRIFSLFFPSH